MPPGNGAMCKVHALRNVLNLVPKKEQAMVASIMVDGDEPFPILLLTYTSVPLELLLHRTRKFIENDVNVQSKSVHNMVEDFSRLVDNAGIV